MEFLTAQAILDAEDIVTKEVEVPEWGGKVLLRRLTGLEASKFLEEHEKDKNKSAVYLLSMSMVDDTGALLFPDPASVKALQQKSLAAIMRLQRVAMQFNGLSDKDAETVKNG